MEKENIVNEEIRNQKQKKWVIYSIGIFTLIIATTIGEYFLFTQQQPVISEKPTISKETSTINSSPGKLITLKAQDLHFGTTIYPFRKDQDVNWILLQAKALGLTELRVETPREDFERSSNDSIYDPQQYRQVYPDRMDILRNSGFDFIFTLDGHHVDSNGKTVDWPRNTDGTIDGQAASIGMANYAKWMVEQTSDFVKTYELWNEAFTNYWDSFGKKGFGAGGSKKNANNYAAMFLPVIQTIKNINPNIQVTIEGNYWNTEKSIGQSPLYQELLQKADYAILHPYTYSPDAYTENGNIGQIMNYDKQTNSALGFWWTEYNVSPKSAIDQKEFSDAGQAKAILRATLLHLAHGVTHLDLFDLYYPSKPQYTLIDQEKNRKPAWYVIQRFLTTVGQKEPSNSDTLIRNNQLSSTFTDLAISHQNGFTYLIWQETPVSTFDKNTPNKTITVSLKTANGKMLKLGKVIDPITGNEVTIQTLQKNGELSLTLPVSDYPLLYTIEYQ